MSNMAELRYLLDTNIISALIRQPQGPVAAMLARRGYGSVCTSIVVAAELRFGARKLGSKTLTGKVDDLLASLPVLPLDSGADRTYAEIRLQLERAGTHRPQRPADRCACPGVRAYPRYPKCRRIRASRRAAGRELAEQLGVRRAMIQSDRRLGGVGGVASRPGLTESNPKPTRNATPRRAL
jgi:predicted nucleic acid-binding protein